ncbi:unnamed protein product, partial [marine sediment metagenome]
TYGQTGSTSSRTIRKYGKGRIIKKDRTRYLGRNLVFKTDVLTFNDEKTGKTVTLPLSEVDYVSKIGNCALEGALMGGGLMLLGIIAAKRELKADPYRTLKENAGEIFVGLTVAGTVIGGLIGLVLPTEKTVYQKGRFRAQISLFPHSIKGKNKNISVPIIAVDILF